MDICGVASSDLPPRECLSDLAGIPSLIVSWVGDRIHPVSSAEELHRLLPGLSFLLLMILRNLNASISTFTSLFGISLHLLAKANPVLYAIDRSCPGEMRWKKTKISSRLT